MAHGDTRKIYPGNVLNDMRGEHLNAFCVILDFERKNLPALDKNHAIYDEIKITLDRESLLFIQYFLVTEFQQYMAEFRGGAPNGFDNEWISRSVRERRTGRIVRKLAFNSTS